ncbi:flp pilus assembly protein [Vibrio sp. JCM 19236]|nr:flp pilus assembly protein [Vibrio sp. JCM 19236]
MNQSVMLNAQVQMSELIDASKAKIAALFKKEDGVTAVEYAIIAVAMSGIVLGAMNAFGPQLDAVWAQIQNSLAASVAGIGTP